MIHVGITPSPWATENSVFASVCVVLETFTHRKFAAFVAVPRIESSIT